MADNRRVDFNDLRRRADFRAILAHYGLKPVGNGDQVKVLCPFHPDEEPSCSVNLGKRIYHCFACQAAGNVLEFIARKNGDEAMEGENIVEAGIIYDGEFDDIGIQSSLVGLYGRLRNGGEETFGSGDWWSATYGATLEISGISVGASVGTDHLGDQDHQFMTAGVGYSFGEVSTSITYGWVWDSNDDFSEANGVDKPRNLVFSAGYDLAPGLALQGDVALVDNDTNSNYDGGTGDTGWAGVARFEVAF